MRINGDTWSEIAININQGRLFFWGAGNMFHYFCSYIEREGISLIPESIIDNDSLKKNSFINIMNVHVPVISWDDIQIIKNEIIVVIVTLRKYQEVLKQLAEHCHSENMHILTYEYVMGVYRESEIMNKKLLFPVKRKDKPVIPKMIHYCWFGGNPLPEKSREYIKGWREKCPDYEIKEWNETNYDISKNIFMKQAWEKKRWAFATDYARLDIVYEHGGIYLDIDVEILKNLDDLLYQEAYLGFESNKFVNTGLGFGARKYHPLIKEMRDDYSGRVFSEDGTIHNCPYYQTDCLKRHGLVLNGQHQHLGDVTIYPASVLCSYCFISKKEIRTPYSYTMHHYDASWLK